LKPQSIVRRIVAPEHPLLAESRWHPVLRRVYAARGIADAQALDLRLTYLAAPDTLGGLDTACDLLVEAIVAQQSILVVGDFDADGATGTAVALRGLRMLGADRVGFRVPHRVLHGYGLSTALVDELANNPPDLLITVDNGIACVDGVLAAKALGCRVIVTDHHLPGPLLPNADAIVNPNLQHDAFPSKALAGVGVMFYLLIALRARLRDRGRFEQRDGVPDLSVLLDLVALGTVADLVPLDRNNRVLVAAGLRRINAGIACAGIAALLRVAGRDCAKVNASDLGFVLGPRINAAGRLEDMSTGIQCLLSDNADHATQWATQLDAINRERRDVQADMVAEAELWLAQHHADLAAMPSALSLFDERWHAGVVGLVASKLKERVHRPVIAFAPAAPGNVELKGSGRSIPGVNIRDLLAEVNALHPNLIMRFGGHAMAAGLSIDRSNIERFRAAFDGVSRARIDPQLFDACVLSDGALQAHEIDFPLAEALRSGGPWGQAFPEPMFDGTFDIDSARVMGARHLSLRLRCADSGRPFDAVYFGGYSGTMPSGRWQFAYVPEVDEWREESRLRLMIRHAIQVRSCSPNSIC
jgi:single-stranded-DNA-specific exonuclease